MEISKWFRECGERDNNPYNAQKPPQGPQDESPFGSECKRDDQELSAEPAKNMSSNSF